MTSQGTCEKDAGRLDNISFPGVWGLVCCLLIISVYRVRVDDTINRFNFSAMAVVEPG